MSAVTRRGALSLLPIAAAAGAAGLAPTAANAAREDPHQRVWRLIAELREALSEAWDGRFMAEIYPATRSERGDMLMNIESRDEWLAMAQYALRSEKELDAKSPEDQMRWHGEQIAVIMSETNDDQPFTLTLDLAQRVAIVS